MTYVAEFEKRFQEIDKGKEPTRSRRLATLMNDMEQVYKIPIYNYGDFKQSKPKIFVLYQKVSNARCFEDVN